MATLRTLSRSRRVVLIPGKLGEQLRSICIPQNVFSLAGFRAWAKSDTLPEKARVTFLDGDVYLDMSIEALETHSNPKWEVARVLLNLDRKLRRGTYYGSGPLVTNEEAQISNNPDGIFFLRKSLRSGQVRLVPKKGERGQYDEVLGTPDWLMEIVSTASVQKDKVQLPNAYHRAGVSEFWLIDARKEKIDFKILLWQATGYAPALKRGSWQRSQIFGRLFRLTRKRDEAGLWEYSLEMRKP